MTDTKQITQTQALLAQIPALAAQLPDPVTGATSSSPEDSSGARSVPGSRAPLSVDLLDLLAGRQLEWWVLLAIDEMTEQDVEPQNPPSARIPTITDNCRWLADNTAWIIEHNPDVPAMVNRKTGKTIRAFTGFATDIQELHGRYLRAAGHTPGPKINCPDCGNRAYIEDDIMRCTEVEDHDRTVRSIEHEHRYAPAETTRQIVARFGITEDRIHQWRKRRKLAPAKAQGRSLLWWPWDVFCLLNPTVAEAINARDEHNAKEPA